MNKRLLLFILMVMVLSATGCIKDTYNMKNLYKDAHLTPSLVISAVNGDVSLKDIVKTNDTVVFDQNKLLTFVFRRDSVFNIKASDFSKGTQTTAEIKPTNYSLGISDVLSHISGNVKFFSPSIIINYKNSFPDSMTVTLNAKGIRNTSSVDLTLAPFALERPDTSVEKVITASYTIDKNNSNLPDLISLPPEEINFSGTAVMSLSSKGNNYQTYASGSDNVTGSVEVDVPMDLEMKNLEIADTIDNFLSDDNNNDSLLKPKNIKLLSIKISAENGFPLGASVQISLYDSTNTAKISTIESPTLLGAAPVDSNGKATGTTATTATIEFTDTFFSKVNNADKIIIGFTLNTTGNGAEEVKIYSDYRISFTAALVFKPDIDLNNN